ncbi:MAG: stringent starvation protein A, partial [Zetaproteobacteria bacterium]
MAIVKLYSDPRDAASHMVRLAMEEKELPATIVDVDPEAPSPEFLKVNPTGEVPAIVDSDQVLIDPIIIIEYLDERYPHPPLKPEMPIDRAYMRLAIRRIERDFIPLFERLVRVRDPRRARKDIQEYLAGMNASFAGRQWIVGDQYTLADIVMAPMLYRLEAYKV